MANKLAKSGKSKMKGNTGREREREREREIFFIYRIDSFLRNRAAVRESRLF
jgi:hypothetical protein